MSQESNGRKKTQQRKISAIFFFFCPPKAFLHNMFKTHDEMLFTDNASSALDNNSEMGYAV